MLSPSVQYWCFSFSITPILFSVGTSIYRNLFLKRDIPLMFVGRFFRVLPVSNRSVLNTHTTMAIVTIAKIVT